MAVTIETKDVEKEVKYLKDVDVQFVSIVPHGANRQPFKIMKSEDGMAAAIQSILIAKPETIETVVEKDGYDWLSALDPKTKQEFDTYFKYEHQDLEDFDKEQMTLANLGQGVYALAGPAMKVKADSLELPTPPMNQPVSEMQPPPIQLSFGEVFFRELDTAVAGTISLMGQAKSETKVRKKGVMSVWKNFVDFLSMALDNVPGDKVKMDERKYSQKGDGDMPDGLDEAKVKEMIDEALKTGFESFETKVAELIQKSLPQKEGDGDVSDKDANADNDVATDDTKTKSDDTENKIEKQIQDLAKVVEGLAGSVDKVKEDLSKARTTPSADPASTDLEGKDRTKEDDEDLKEVLKYDGIGVPPGDLRHKVMQGSIFRRKRA